MRPFWSSFRKLRRDSSGASAIEAAICFPILIMFIFGTFETGIFFVNAHDVKSSMGEAVREISIEKNLSQGSLNEIVTRHVPQELATNVTTTTTITEEFGERFASIAVEYSSAFSVPFLDRYPVTSRFVSYVILTDDEDLEEEEV